ncbi:MAG: hypothetical protein PWQ82_575 [Thermosediminibacterales bacterium]|nr:hypothetical protein [Thermosediminibacterales bacterium]MDK2835501.1 hypothetical protein [Thermosediminibacterales bacterium]
MECLNCGNCKQNQDIYYCLMRNEFIISDKVSIPKEKSRQGWKKGDPDYELRRRKVRKERDDIKKII